MPYVGAMSRKSRPDEPRTQDPAPGHERPPPPEAPAGEAQDKPERPDPTRYGDWEIDGRCIDF